MHCIRLLSRVSAAPLSRVVPAFGHRRREVKTAVNLLRRGNVVTFRDRLQYVEKRDQHMTGRGGSIIKVELKDLVSGKRTSERFGSNDSLDVVQLQSAMYQYLYRSGQSLHLLHSETYEPLEASIAIVEGDDKQLKLLEEGMQVQIQTIAEQPDEPLTLRLPATHVYSILRDEPIAGQASKGVSYKTAFISGAGEDKGQDAYVRIMVPEFVQVGDRVVVDTTQAAYSRRAGTED